jgi:hypothetical protein
VSLGVEENCPVRLGLVPPFLLKGLSAPFMFFFKKKKIVDDSKKFLNFQVDNALYAIEDDNLSAFTKI